MKNRILFTFLTCLTFINAIAQNKAPGFIEVIVEDTLKVTPQEIQYYVQIKPDYNYEELTDTIVNAKSNKRSYKNEDEIILKILNFIKQNSIDTLDTVTLPINVQKFAENSVYKEFILLFKTEQSFNNFLRLTKPMKTVEGFFLKQEHSNLKRFEEVLYKKLIDDSFERAAFLARTSKRLLGEILEIREIAETNYVSGWTAYPPLSMLYSANSDFQITVYKKIVVKYELF